MKNLLKIGSLSLVLIASIFLLSNTTKAGTVTLEITGTPGSCVVGTDVAYGQHAFSYTGYNIDKNFDTVSGNNLRLCNDSQGKGPWTVEISSTNVLNMTTADALHTIPNTNLTIKNDGGVLNNGSCTVNAGNAITAQALSSNVVLFGKTSATGEVCQISADHHIMNITLANSQALGMYSGTLTITVPSL